MKIEINPSRLAGTVTAPPSKSMGHRMLICAGLASGKSRISGISDSEDMLATLDVLAGLGATYQKTGDVVEITGIDPRESCPTLPLSCRECGSTLRFFIPICLLSEHKATLCGAPRLFARPLDIYAELCRDQGLLWQPHDDEPALTVQGTLHGGDITLRGDVSSQFVTGLLLALPLCDEDSVIRILPPFESRSYVDLTLSALRAFGISAEWQDELTLRIAGGQHYTPTDCTVEGDYSNAAFFDALALVGHDVRVAGLDEHSLQGDRVYRAYFPELAKGHATLSIGDCPDLGPILMAVAAAKHGATLTETRRLRIKESDRGAAMAQELAKFGVRVTVEEDTITVDPADLHAPSETLCSHNDHRIVMALCTLLTLTGGVIEGAEAVRKSLPDYFDMIKALGCEVYIK